jgi:hypothetical protein
MLYITFLDLYHNLSGHTFYKHRIRNEVGINALLIFNLDGIPFIARDYLDDELKTSKDYIFVSAFISSILKFIKIEGKSYITDFGIGSSRYYLKFDENNTVYCIILNEILHRRITGEQLIIFVEIISKDVKRLFNSYYISPENSKYLQKQEYDEKFCLHLDKMFLENFEYTIKADYIKQNLAVRERPIDFLIKIDPDHLPEPGVQQRLLSFGIKGLIICGLGGDIPIILRNYDPTNKENIESSYFFCGLSNLLNKFALTNFGFFTDVGFGYKRVMFKFKTKNKLTLCLILSEILFRRLTGETLSMFTELVLMRIHNQIGKNLPNLRDLSIADIESEQYKALTLSLDDILFENSQIAISELTSPD